MDSCVAEDNPSNGVPQIEVQTEISKMESNDCLLKLEELTLLTPNSGTALIKNLSLEVGKYVIMQAFMGGLRCAIV